MATFKQIDELVVGDKILCLGLNNEPVILTVEEVSETLDCVIVEEMGGLDLSLDGGYYCVTEELNA